MTSRVRARSGHLLLLLREERLLLPELRLPLALARSLCALLFCELALPPLLAAWARLILPADGEDDLEDEEEEELRDAIACSFGSVENDRLVPALAATGSI
jgi:hypothetical protein